MHKEIEGIFRKHIEIFNVVNNLDTLTYSDYYFFQNRLKKSIDFLAKELEMDIKVGLNKCSWKYIKNGE